MSSVLSDGESRVTIARLRCDYLVPREHPDPDGVRWRLDALARTQVPLICGRMLEGALDPHDDAIWLIRRLEIELAADIAAFDDQTLAQAWSGRIATSLARALRQGPDGSNVLRFPNQAAYAAQFLTDLAEGQAWERWYYRTFEGLRSLPTSAALREAWIRQPEHAETILLDLAARGRLDRVVAALAPADASRIYAACAAADAGDEDMSPRAAADALLANWPQVFAPSAAIGHNQLRLYAITRQIHPGVSPGNLRRALDALLGLARLLSIVADSSPFLAALARGDLSGTVAAVRAQAATEGLESLPFLLQAGRGGRHWLAGAATIVGASAVPAVTVERQLFVTPFGGIFLILPALLELDLEGILAAAGYPSLNDQPIEPILRWLLLLKCLGRSRATAAALDPALALAAGLDTPPLTALRDWDAATAAHADGHALGYLAAELARAGRAEGRTLYADLVEATDNAPATLLLRDLEGDAWLYAAQIARAEQAAAALAQGVQVVSEGTGLPVGTIWLSPALDGKISPLPVTHGEQDADRVGLTNWQGRTRNAADDLAYLALTGLPIIGLAPDIGAPAAPGLDLTWSLVARAGLRAFAARLMGFAASSPAYLFDNFLAGDSLVQVQPGQIEVELPASPLHVLLHMAGVNGQTYTVPWLHDTQITLHVPAS